MNGYTNQYLANSVNTAAPEQLMLMLYDGAIRFISLGIQAIENGIIDKRAYYINKTSAIVSEFAATLDHSQDAKLAEDLDALYGYMLRRMMEANMKNDPVPLIEVKELLSGLRATWARPSTSTNRSCGKLQGPNSPAKNDNTYRPLAAAM
jgi:flagellar secretion chaperone FliS